MSKQIFEAEYNKLNKQQKEAVDSIYWPIMVVAGPGTGKTQIIALRTANIILQTGVDPSNILITTFTEAWVIAIKERLVKFLWQDWYKVKVSTFHAFSSEVISDFPENFLEQRAKNVIDDIESYEILSEIIDKNIKNWGIKELFNTMDRFAYLRDIKDRISKLKTEWISFEWFNIVIEKQAREYEEKLLELENNKRIRDLEKRRSKDKEIYDKHINKLRELNLVYKEYDDVIREKWLYDFADMINFVTEKFKTDEEILAYYAEKFQFIMIDEFQDTNNSQNHIINLIMDYFPEEQNIMVVWDDDQSIYRFQGANIENMLDFASKYSDTKHIVLEQNYRSSQKILDLSQNLIKNNSQRISNRLEWLNKNLIAVWKHKDVNENKFIMLDNDLLEKEFVYREIEKKLPHPNPLLWEERGQEENISFAIIVKSNKQIWEWTEFLTEKWLKVNSKNSTNILNNHYCNFLLDFLKFIENPYFNDTSLLNLLRSDLVDIENVDAIYMSRNLYQRNYSRDKFKLWLWDIIKSIPHPNPLPEGEGIAINFKNIEKIIEFRELVTNLNSSLWNSWITSLLRDVLEKLNIFDFIEKNWSFDDLQDIFSFVNKIKTYIENNKDITLSNILNKFDLYKKYWVSISRENIKTITSNIEILTAHGSKWLEYDYVFIPEVFEWNWNKRAIPDKLKLPIWIIWNGLQYSDLTEKEFKELEKEISTEEERRLFFVAITRAKQSLIFTIAWSKENKILLKSSFIEEVGIEAEKIDLEMEESELKEILISSMLKTTLVNTNEDEINFISKFLETYKLSPTDLNKFIEDPKKFLNEVVFKYPFLSNENLVFWSAYHKVLEILSVEKYVKWNILSLNEVKNLFITEIKKHDLTPEEYTRLVDRWNEWLKWYYEIFKQNNRWIIQTEYNFRSKNIVFEWIPLTGKIDKIEICNGSLLEQPHPNSEKTSPQPSPSEERGQTTLFTENVALVDYKTWSVKSNWIIKWTDRYWEKKAWEWAYFRQLLFYKLMFENNSELNSKYNIWELALDFVEGKNGEYKYSVVDYTHEEYEKFKNELKEARSKICNIDFWREELKN